MIIILDKTLFHFINSELSSPILDFLLIWIRHPLFWAPLYIFLIAFMLFNFGGRRGYRFILFILLVFGTGDVVSSRIVKPSVGRLRPCNQEELNVVERVPCGVGYSFTSSHATNHFGIATFVALTLGTLITRIRPWLWLWAALISFAQIYVGVHFPLDILGGTILGIMIGWGWAIVYERLTVDPLLV
jgi:membrane-associated phospholipid phosphatase